MEQVLKSVASHITCYLLPALLIEKKKYSTDVHIKYISCTQHVHIVIADDRGKILEKFDVYII